jgi:Glycosyl transferase family group 2/PilZ domain
MESRRDWPARAIAALALILGVRYLVWRVDSTMSHAWLPLTLALFAGELYALLSLAGFTFTTWRLRPVDRIEAARLPSVDVFVPTYDEDEQVLRSTLIGCAALDYPDFAIWVLDDGRRPWVRELAGEIGARYLTRDDNSNAKAGNINAALPRTSGELILILDADHVPQPQMLQAVVGHFGDERLAYVQTPHEFYNRDSVQHVERDDHDQSMFFHVVQPGRDDHGAAFWCGSGAVIRRAALEEVGGLATDTITEDFHTSLRIHRCGWRSRFHDEGLVFGIAPHNLEQFLLQRHRWAAGNLATLRTADSPMRASNLTLRQRLCYIVGLAEVLTALQRALLIVVLAVTVGWGRLPLHASAGQFLAEFVPWAVASTLASLMLSGGRLKLLTAVRFEYYTLPAHLRAVLALVWPDHRFKVTPKTGVDGGGLSWLRLNIPLALLVAALGGALLWRAGVQAGALPGRHLAAPLLAIVAATAAFELARLMVAVLSLTRRRQVRLAYRFPSQLPATLAGSGQRVTVTDMSVGGCALQIEAPAIRATDLELAVDLGALGVRRFRMTDIWARRMDGGMRVSGRWSPMSPEARDALYVALFVLGPPVRILDEATMSGVAAQGVARRLGLGRSVEIAA